MTESSHKRLNWLLILQGWAILCVVVGHAPLLSIAQGNTPPDVVYWLYKFVYSFHMPLFIFVSGYLFQMTRIERPMAYGRMIVEKLTRLGIPFLVFTIAAMVLKSIFAKEMIRPTTISIGNLMDAILYPGESPLCEMWFIAVLMWFFTLKPIWCTKGWREAIPVILFTASFYAPETPFRNLFCHQEAYHYAIFFLLGILARRYGVFEKPLKFGISVAMATIAWSVVADVIVHCITGGTAERYISLPLVGIAASAFAAILADRFIPKIFESFRNYSYQIYLMGIFFQIAVKIAYRHGLIPSYALGYIICIVIGVYAPVAVSRLVEKSGIKAFKLCIGLK